MPLSWRQLVSLLGPPGPQGPAGAGIPTGGTTNQWLRKQSAADHDSEWDDLPLLSTTSPGVLPASSYALLPYNPAIALDLAALDKSFRSIVLEGSLDLSALNLAAGQELRLRLLAGSSQRALSFPLAWAFVCPRPTSIQATKTAVLSLAVFGSGDGDVVASYSEQP